MSGKSPLGKIKDVADVAVVSVVSTVSGAVKDPVGTGQKVVGQALGVPRSPPGPSSAVAAVPGLRRRAGAPRRSEPVPKATSREVAPKTCHCQDRRATKATAAKKAACEEGTCEEGHAREEAARSRRTPPSRGLAAASTVRRREPPRPRRRRRDGRRDRSGGLRHPPWPSGPWLTRPMARIPTLSRTLSQTIPFARGVADRAVSTAGPIVVGVVGRVTAHLPRRSRTEPSHPETFTPSPVVDEPQVPQRQHGQQPATVSRRPWPATCPGRVRPPSRPPSPSLAPCPAPSSRSPAPAPEPVPEPCRCPTQHWSSWSGRRAPASPPGRRRTTAPPRSSRRTRCVTSSAAARTTWTRPTTRSPCWRRSSPRGSVAV